MTIPSYQSAGTFSNPERQPLMNRSAAVSILTAHVHVPGRSAARVVVCVSPRHPRFGGNSRHWEYAGVTLGAMPDRFQGRPLVKPPQAGNFAAWVANFCIY